MNLEIYGSYEKSISESKIIKGHGNIKYVVGGNARYATRSNIIEWGLVVKSPVAKQIKVINDILQFPQYLDDHETLQAVLHEINALSAKDFYKLLENSLQLKDALMIQLRRLFYIIDVLCQKQSTSIIQHNYKRPTEFCPYEPVKRIQMLLDVWHDDKDYTKVYAALKPLLMDFIVLLQKKYKLLSTKLKSAKAAHDITGEMNVFVVRYKSAYNTLDALEKINVQVAQRMEKILDVLESF